MREDLIASAVSFLSDPKVQSAALTKKVSFLESKGLTSEEIAEAMARVNGKSSAPIAPSTTAVVPHAAAAAGGYAVTQAPPVPQRPSYDWRDIFVAAVLAGGVGYGVWQLAKRLFGPWFKVPTQKELDEDKAELDAKFQQVEDSLKAVKDQTSDVLAKVNAQAKSVDKSLGNLETVLKDLKQGDALRDAEFKNVKGDVESIKEMVPKLLDRNKEAQAAILDDLQNEIKSLKSLLVARQPATAASSLLNQTTPSSAPATPAADSVTSTLSPRLSAALGSSSRPGIPAWQIAASKANEKSTESANESSSSTSASTTDAAN